MPRIKGLSNENYADRKDAISRTLKAAYEGYAAEPIPPEWMERLDKAAPRRTRNWRTAVKAALDIAFGDELTEPVPTKEQK